MEKLLWPRNEGHAGLATARPKPTIKNISYTIICIQNFLLQLHVYTIAINKNYTIMLLKEQDTNLRLVTNGGSRGLEEHPILAGYKPYS